MHMMSDMSLRQGLLALLNEEPKYGYQLKVEFESATGGMWPVNVGQVYTTLDRLVRDRDDQKQYRLTLDGSRQLGEWWQAVPGDDPPPRDELIVKVLLAVATTPDDALAVITAQRTAVLELLQQRRRMRRDANRHDIPLAERLADDALVVRAEADLRWLDLCESRVLDRGRDRDRAAAPPGSGGRVRPVRPGRRQPKNGSK
jgi:DNA-binding PadR family transcriptional regulator